MVIKLSNKSDFLNFFDKSIKDATAFYFESLNNNPNDIGFMLCHNNCTIIYECKNYEERNNILDYFIKNSIRFITTYGQKLPDYNYDFSNITLS